MMKGELGKIRRSAFDPAHVFPSDKIVVVTKNVGSIVQVKVHLK